MGCSVIRVALRVLRLCMLLRRIALCVALRKVCVRSCYCWMLHDLDSFRSTKDLAMHECCSSSCGCVSVHYVVFFALATKEIEVALSGIHSIIIII